MPLEGGEHDAEACTSRERFVAERGAADEQEYLFAICVEDEAIATNAAVIYLNGEKLGGRGGRCRSDEDTLGVGDGIGNRNREAGS